MSQNPFIPMVDLRAQFAPLRSEILTGISAILESAHFILGEQGRSLEQEIASLLGVSFAAGCASGTDALMLALRALDIGPGDEVIVPTFTFIATAEAVRYVGATPVFVDVDPHHFTMDLEAMEAAVTPRTRAVIPVHLYGQPADMYPILKIAGRFGLKVIEDCAQSIGAHIEGRMTGSYGHIGAYSFFPSKNLGAAGDGGMVVTADQGLADKLRALRNHGSTRQYHHDILGYNSRLDELQALILRVKLPHLESYNARRRQVAAWYGHYLGDMDLQLPMERPAFHHVYHQFTIRVRRRDRVKAYLQENRIASAIYYPVPGHRQKAFADLPPAHCPVADRLATEVLSLPMYPELEEEQVARIAATVRDALGE